MCIDTELLDSLLEQAKQSERLRLNFDLRTSANEHSQRMLNALLPGTLIPIHRHPHSNEVVLLLRGRLYEVFYDEDGAEKERVLLSIEDGQLGVVVPADTWHSIEVVAPSVVCESKDGCYGADGTEARPMTAKEE